MPLGELALGKDDALAIADLDGTGSGRSGQIADRRFGFDHNRFGLFILSKAQIARMAQYAFVGKLDEGDLGDELRLDPMGAAHGSPGCFHGCGLLFERRHQRHQALDLVAREPSSNLPRVSQYAPLVHSQQQSAKAPLLVRGCPSDDDKLLAADALGLDPGPRARARIARVGAFRDDALQSRTAKTVEKLLAAPDYMVGIAQMTLALADQRGEKLLAFQQRPLSQIFAVELEQVECEIIDRVRVVLERCLQSLETGPAVGQDHDRFTVDQGAFSIERDRVADQSGEPVRPVQPRARVGAAFAIADGKQRAVSVIFELVQPAITRRHMVDKSRQLHGLERRQDTASFPALRRPGRLPDLRLG